MSNPDSSSKKSLAKKIRNFSLISILGFILLLTLYVNDQSYRFIDKKINPFFINNFNKDILYKVNTLSAHVDIASALNRMMNPLNDSDKIELIIPSETQQMFLEYAKIAAVDRSSARLKKAWGEAQVVFLGDTLVAKAKLHGTNFPHFQNNKFSYTIKITQDEGSIYGLREFKLIKGEECHPISDAFNHVATDLNLISPAGVMKMVYINQEKKGVYCFVERIKNDYLRKFGMEKTSKISLITDWTNKDTLDLANHVSDNDLHFSKIETSSKKKDKKALYQYKLLAEAMGAKDTERLKSMFNLEYLAKFLALVSFTNYSHQLGGDNLVIIYNFDDQKFYPIFREELGGRGASTQSIDTQDFRNYNKLVFSSGGTVRSNSDNMNIFRFLLSDDDFRSKRDHWLWELTKDHDLMSNKFKAVYAQSEYVMDHQKSSRRAYHFNKIKQLENIEWITGVARQYLNYGHVYCSLDETNNKLHVLADSYVALDFYINDSKLNSTEMAGFIFDADLNTTHRDFVFDLDSITSSALTSKDLIFVNRITSDTIASEDVFLNYFISPEKEH